MYYSEGELLALLTESKLLLVIVTNRSSEKKKRRTKNHIFLIIATYQVSGYLLIYSSNKTSSETAVATGVTN